MVDIAFHETQMKVFNDTHKFRVSVNARRWGKSRLVTYELILAALGFKGEYDPVSPQVVLGAMPTAVQARKILWEPLVYLATTEFKQYVKAINRTEMVITFRGSVPCIRIVGANDNNGDRLRGLRLYFVALDEMQNINPTVIDNIIMPAMADTPGSRCLITGTPLGKANILYYLFKRQDTMLDWVSFNFKTSDNPFVSRDEIARARETLAPRDFKQEYEASFESFAGRVYTELDVDSMIPHVTREPEHYIMGVDFGDVNPAVVILGVNRDETGEDIYTYIQGWSNNTDKVVPNYVFANVVERFQGKYQCSVAYCDPSRPSAILELRKVVPAIAGFNRIDEGVAQIHSLIHQKRLLFAVKTEHIPGLACVNGMQAYEEMYTYHYAIDKDGTITGKIADGQIDHITDAIRYGLARKKPR